MTALHVWLLGLGAVLALGPIVLHLLLQDKPKRLPFPALRFVMARQQHARRSYRLRHWVLLALRVAVIGLVALALSRPAAATALFGSSLLLGATLVSGALFLLLTLSWRHQLRSADEALASRAASVNGRNSAGGARSAGARGLGAGGAGAPPAAATEPGSRGNAGGGRARNWPIVLLTLVVLGHGLAAGWLATQLFNSGSGPVLTGKQPVAAAIVIDTSPRMLYRLENQTRLERAQSLAASIVERLPAGSQVMIVDSGPNPVGLSLDLAAAKQQISALRINYQSQPLPNRVRAATQLLADSPLEGRELFVVSDLSRPSWTAAGSAAQRLELDDGLSIYVVDVGAKSHENWSIDQWDLPTPAITPGGTIQVNATIARKAVRNLGEDLMTAVAADRNRGTDATAAAAEPEGADDVAEPIDLGAADAAMATELPAEGRTVRLLIEKPEAGKPVHRNGETLVPSQYWERVSQVNLAPGQSTEVSFSVPDLPEGIHHGWVEIVGGDALGFDNRRFFTITVQPAWRALIVNGPGVNDANFLEAIAPETVRDKGQAVFDCRVIRDGQLGEVNLTDFRAVFFLNPGPLGDDAWRQLDRYVSGGGSVGFFLGHNALSLVEGRSVPHPSFNGPLAQRVLPGVLEAPWRQPDGLLFEPTAWDHPIFSRMQPLRTVLMWNRLPIFMHFGLQATETASAAKPEPAAGNAVTASPALEAGSQADGVVEADGVGKSDVVRQADGPTVPDSEAPTKAVRVLATYSNNIPALVEATVGQGQLLLMTTPVTDPTRPDDGRRPWNSFAISDERSFTYWLLTTEIARYLATIRSANLNGVVGDSFVLPNDQLDAPARYALYRPENQEPVDVAVERNRLYLDFNDRPGVYRLRGVNNQQQVHLRGFSANVPGNQSDLARIGKPQLDGWLGRGRYAVAENEDQIQRAQGAGRVGLEFYPSLIRLLAVVFLAEMLVSNWFYREPPRKRTAHELVAGDSP